MAITSPVYDHKALIETTGRDGPLDHEQRHRGITVRFRESDADTPRQIVVLPSEGPHITAKVDKPMVGANLAAHLDALRTAMRKAAENLEFEEAARLRDEVKRLEAVELAVADDPLARQSAVEEAVDEAVKARGRSTAGRAGMRGGKARRGR